MRRVRARTDWMTPMGSTRARPVALAPGALYGLGAWFIGLAIVRLTGAAAVLLLLTASIVAMFGALMSGWWRLRSIRVTEVRVPPTATAGHEVGIAIDHTDPRRSSAPVMIRLFGTPQNLTGASTTSMTVVLMEPGVLTSVNYALESRGIAGLVTWRRPGSIAVDQVHVAPAARGPILPVEHATSRHDGSTAHGAGPQVGELDGARPWRPGEGNQSIHWPSTMRAGEVIAHDRSAASEAQWSVSLASDPARLRWTMEDGLRRGHDVMVTDTVMTTLMNDESERSGSDDRQPVRTNDDAMRWSAIASERSSADHPAESASAPWWRRPISFSSSNTPEPVPMPARLVTSAAGLIALWMLLGALASPLSQWGFVALGIAIATAASLRYSNAQRPAWARAIVVIVALAALARIAVQSSGIGGLLAALRGPLPDLLILLVILHGAEIADKRTNRVHLAMTGVVVAYAAGLRIDGTVGWWMLAWGACAIAAFGLLDAQRIDRARRGAIRRIGAWTTAGAMCTIGLAAFVPVPDGPASLGLPSLSSDDAQVNGDGALVGPDGNPTAPNSTGDPTRGALGQAGGYPGFSDTLDTAVRGDLGDEIVMRVRAPEPAFWRGQTFTQFDGRVWRVADVEGRRIEGPEIGIGPTIGDLPMVDVATEEFVQTFHVEADLPNVVFAAARPETVIFDGSVFARPDGAIRADRTLASGTVYSVVSQRVPVTPESLRAQGDLGARFAPFADRHQVAPFLEIPASTSLETLELAARLRVDGSTYDTIRAYERWMSTNTEYDLDAPVPDGDAVDDFLFHSQRGFCEQIASSLVVMLRSQGVPARLATGYIPGTRDRISGVFEVQASDAHAWVEVWFPDSGWEAFDPTASVPLSGDAERTTVGSDAASAVLGGIAARPAELLLVAVLGALVVAAFHLVVELRRRRRRGPWGLLHDRFMALAPEALTAPRVATSVAARCGPVSSDPFAVAVLLDRVAFDPSFDPDDDVRRVVSADIRAFERAMKRQRSRTWFARPTPQPMRCLADEL